MKRAVLFTAARVPAGAQSIVVRMRDSGRETGFDHIDTIESPRDYDPDTLGRRLSKWFTEHFRTHDARLHRWLVGRA